MAAFKAPKVLDEAGNVVETIGNEEARPLV